LKFKLLTLLIIIVPIAVFFAGVARKRPVTIHVGMGHDEVLAALRSASAEEVACPLSYPARVQTMGYAPLPTCWKLPNSHLTIETKTSDDLLLYGLCLEGQPVKKLQITNRGEELTSSNELTADELETQRRNRPLPGGNF